MKMGIKVMVHEITHMFGVKHCIYYDCCMNGSNHYDEFKARTLLLCPVCLRKLQASIKFDILQRYKALLKTCQSKKFLNDYAPAYAKLISDIEASCPQK